MPSAHVFFDTVQQLLNGTFNKFTVTLVATKRQAEVLPKLKWS